jgi:dTDP-4-amino-4,6-dideoxygalactose transaminase
MSELQAAMGLAIFPYINHIISERKKVVDYYQNHLNLSELKFLKIREDAHWNYSYFPIIFKNESVLLDVEKRLNKEKIFPRRYFYPSLSTIPFINGHSMPISENIASRILCLPLYVGLNKIDLKRIVSLVNENIC